MIHNGVQALLTGCERDALPGGDLVADSTPPADASRTSGNRCQYLIVVPPYDPVIVRHGLDHGRQGFDKWDLLREIVRTLPTGD
jgi:hypothetical protein